MKKQNKLSTLDMIYIALFGILIGICAWITIPGALPFTLQTFGVFLTVSVLGGKRGTAAVLLYIFIGLLGIPIFSGFQGGIGVILGPTGGYIIGFIFSALIMWLFEIFSTKNLYLQGLSMITALFVCYTFGTMWYLMVYSGNSEGINLITVISLCVVPFIIPDIIKIVLALFLGKRLRPIILKSKI